MVLLILSFVAGVLTVLAPCILPLLPVIVGGSIGATGEQSSKRKVLVIVASLGASVVLFTLLLKASTAFITIPPFVWTWISGGIVLVFGVTLVFPALWEKLPFLAKLSIGSNRLLTAGHQKNNFWGDALIGAALGPVFSTCSPTYFIVLATVLPEQPLLGFVYLIAYATGLCLMLLLVGLLGQRFADRLGFAADPRGVFKRVLGVIFIAVGIVILTGADKQIQIKLLDAGIYDITKVEQWLLQLSEGTSPQTDSRMPVPTVFDEAMRVAQKEQLFVRAPEIMQPAGYVNTGGEAITIGQFKGTSVVLLDIWTYSCINCQRTIPYLKAWDEKYRDQGLQIIGIHTPEFAFEKDIENVEWAVEQFGIEYPSILDNDYATWKALGNNYWPRKYLVDIDGFIVYDHIGEGGYEEMEAAIQRALMERAMVVGAGEPDTSIIAETIPEVQGVRGRSPEIYFGAWRNERLGNGIPGQMGEMLFTADTHRLKNVLYLDGLWDVEYEHVESVRSGGIYFTYVGGEVYFVATADEAVTIRVFRDGKAPGEFAGEDVDPQTGTATIQQNRLYKLIEGDDGGVHELHIEVDGPGLRAFTFTFG